MKAPRINYDQLSPDTGREHKKRLLMLTADLGKANGMKAGVEILRALAKGRKRVDAAELEATAITMESAILNLEAKTKREMEQLGYDASQL
jgi:hypothetical protein